jgi:hypothetical protein
VKRRQPPDLFPDDLNCLLNICDCSVTAVGGERLPSSSINSVLASLASSYILLPLVAYSLLFYSTMGKSKKGGSSSHHSGDKRKREPTPPSGDFGDSEYSEEFSESDGSPVHASPPASSDDSDDSQGIAVEVWTYIRVVERAGLEGSDESEVSSDEGDSSDSSEGGERRRRGRRRRQGRWQRRRQQRQRQGRQWRRQGQWLGTTGLDVSIVVEVVLVE